MKLIKRICLYLCAALIFLTSCGKREEEYKTENKVSVNKTDIEEEQTDDEVYYDILLEENSLRLYEVRGKGRSLIKTVNIDISYYPDEDISELKSGITAYSKESGFEILENFVN